MFSVGVDTGKWEGDGEEGGGGGKGNFNIELTFGISRGN